MESLPQTAQVFQGMDEYMRRCVELCRDCHDTCVSALAYGLRLGGRHTGEKHLRLMMDCAEICRTCADFMLRESSFHSRVCGVCADICESCADSYESFGDDDFMKQCAGICVQCATSCRQMSVTGSV
ncbi:MAG: four-helix bundle copper-binding protein [Blastocatellia bacterium]